MIKQLTISLVVSGILLVPGLAAQAAHIRRIPQPKVVNGAAAAGAEINHKDSRYYTFPDYFNMTSNKHLTILTHYPTYQQNTEETCGPAAALTVLYYLGDTHWTEDYLSKAMKTQPYPVGTCTTDMVEFFNKIGYKVSSSLTAKEPLENEEDFKNFVIKNLQAKTPILVENVEWGGHWRVLIGYDTMGTESVLDDTLIIADPYDTSDHYQDGYMVENATRFYSMWFDQPSPRKEPSLNKIWVTVKKS